MYRAQGVGEAHADVCPSPRVGAIHLALTRLHVSAKIVRTPVTPILLALQCCIDYNGVVTDIHISHQGDGDPKLGGIVLCCKK
jgi:hypothetical protein